VVDDVVAGESKNEMVNGVSELLVIDEKLVEAKFVLFLKIVYLEVAATLAEPTPATNINILLVENLGVIDAASVVET